MPKDKEDSAKVENRGLGLIQDQLVLIVRMACQEKGVFLDRRTWCLEVIRKKNALLGNHATEMTTRPECEASSLRPSGPFQNRPGLGLVGEERSP